MARGVRPIGDLLQNASRACETGDFEKARKLCRLVLKTHPKQPDALHLLAIVALETKNFAEADRHFRSALAANPRSHQALLNHSIALCELGQYDKALEQCEAALRLDCDRARALVLRGSALRMLKRSTEALASYAQALELMPRNADAHFNRGNVFRDLGRLEEALASYDAALGIAPRHLGALNQRGVTLRELGRYEEALQSLEQALQIDPRSWQAHNNLGNTLLAAARLEEAAAHFQKAIAASPRNAEGHYNLGNTLQELGRHREAMACYSQAIAVQPAYVDAYVNRAGAARKLKLYAEALADYEKARRLNRNFPYLAGHIVDTRAHACDWSNNDDEHALIEAVRAGERACNPFSLLSICDNEADHYACARTWASDKFSSASVLPKRESKSPGLIRVAYLSPDFRNHATSYLLAALIESHDRSRFHVLGLSFGPRAADQMQRRMSAAFDKMIDASGLSDVAAAKALQENGIDIAVDLAGYTEHARPGILARRPAAVQVSYLGYPGTMAAPWIDYIIADRFTIPDDSKPFFSEKVVHLPDTYQANDHKREGSSVSVSRSEVGLPEHGFVFCCFNNAYKIRPGVFDVWMRLLGHVEGSVLWLLLDSDASRDNLRREAERRGVAPHRLVFAPRVGVGEHLARHKLADLFLDTLPYNAHTTASDALRVGVPIVTCMGNSFASRVAASLLHAAGVPEFVTHSLDDYFALALRLARDPALLARRRAALADSSRTLPLFDVDRFRRNIEKAYLMMHERHQAGEQPASFSVT